MANGLNIKLEIKDDTEDLQAVVALIHSNVNPGTRYAKEITALTTAGLFTGKSGSTAVHLLGGSKPLRLIVIGLGEREKASAETYRAAGGTLARLIKKYQLQSIAVLEAEKPAEFVSGVILCGFEFTDFKGTGTVKEKRDAAVKLRIVGKYNADQRTEIQRAAIIAEAQNYARTIANRPGNVINPLSLAEAAEKLGKETGLKVKVLDEKKMKQLGMGGILAVGAGSSATPPRMIVLEHAGKSSSPTLLVVGKAITFDTGGISIKPGPGMQRMVFDKSGGMAVLGLMHAVAKLKVPMRVIGILASAENHISETAYRPGDILKMYNGVTVEVTNTDAEGRLVLGDALAWGIETYKPAAVVDIATLTGGVVVALGKTMAGVMSNNDAIVDQLQAATHLSGEKIWRLPIGDDQRAMLKSNPADILNSGLREALPIQAGAFLSYFVPAQVPWAHLDIAGVAATEIELPYYAKGATGWGVRTLVEWVTARAAAKK